MVLLWEKEEVLAQANRLQDPSAMDIYEVRLEKGKSPRAPSEPVITSF